MLSVAERPKVTVVDLVYVAPLFMLIEPVGAVSALYVTVIVPVAVLPALSVAITAITLLPLAKLTLETLQLVVPLAVPLPPPLLLHVTLITPLVLSEALPPKLMVPVVEVYVALDVGLVMVTVGAVLSKVIESLAVLDTFPAASLYHT